MGAFGDAALRYAALGMAPIPCGGADGKQPLVRWRHIRCPVPARPLELWRRTFADANVGIVTGASHVTVVDVDDPSLAADMVRHCGNTPLITQTPRGGLHLWYRNSGERTVTRLDGARVDVRAIGGFVVVPPSRRPDKSGAYEIVQGTLDDLKGLPPVRSGALPLAASALRVKMPKGGTTPLLDQGIASAGARNDTLFRALLREARLCRTLDELRVQAMTLNAVICRPALPEPEVAKTAPTQ
jgi:hypothetical protein